MLQPTDMIALLGSQLGDQRSHPDKLLHEHLQNVATLAKELASSHGLVVDEQLLTAIALTHDIGKVHPKFQRLLDGVGPGINHAKPSAWFTYSITNDIWAAEVVCRHHTGLRNLDDMIADWGRDQDCEKTMRQLLPGWPFMIDEPTLFQLQLNLYSSLKYEMRIDHWLRVRLLYSLLIAADRMDAIGIASLPKKGVPAFTPPVLPSRSPAIDAWRQKIKETCVENALRVSGPGVYTLTLPTGAGKTLTGLAIAHAWATRFGCKSIIYGLPFISIVEQTAAVAKQVFGDDQVQEDHSLAYSQGYDEDTNDYSKDAAAWKKMSTLFRYWREPVVLTTLVHLWDALFNPRSNRTMNFHRLSNAVIILDEPQTISPRFWHGFGQVLSYLSQEWHTFFLLMTATQPEIVTCRELAPPDTVFPYNRHQYEVLMDEASGKIKKITVDELPLVLGDKLPVRELSGMVVVNRKKAAIRAYRALESLELEAPLLLLSGWLTPYRRRIILRYLKWLERKKRRRYLVATQVVEAGVDLDFGWVFRDLGPLDSIIQVAGRCNRHSREDLLGHVLVAEIVNNKGHSTWKNVYDDILIDKTKEVLIKNPIFEEKEVRRIVEEYYAKVVEGVSPVLLFDKLSRGEWGEYYELIDEDNRAVDTVTVFVEENSKLLPMLRKLEETEWTLEDMDEQKKLVQKVMQYAIEIPKTMITACRAFCARFLTEDEEPVFRPILHGRAWFLGKEAISKDGGLYSPVLGFVPPEEDEDILSPVL